MFDATQEELMAWRERNADSERLRQEGMGRHVVSTGADDFYEVIEEVTPDR